MSFLSEYNFEIKHIKGKENKVVDPLSQHENILYVTTISHYETNLEDKIWIAVVLDQNYQKLKKRTTQNEAHNIKTKSSLNKKGLLTYKNRLYILDSEDIKLLIMDEMHKRSY